MPSSSSGESYAEILLKNLEDDELFNHPNQYTEKNLVSLVTDGAANMIGHKKGFGKIMRDKLNRPDLVHHYCLAHRLERGFGTAMKKYPSFATLETMNNKISSFYTTSHKRTALLDEMMDSEGYPTFRILKTMATRWVASHVEAMIRLLMKWKYILENVMSILGRQDNTEVGERKANNIIDFLQNKHAMMAIAFNIDVQSVFKIESKKFQERYSTLIGQSEREEMMKYQLQMIRGGRGPSFRNFLHECLCSPSHNIVGMPCRTLSDYEVSMYVTFRGYELKEVSDENFPRLSTFWNEYIDDLEDQIHVFFPGEGQKNKAKLKMSAFDPLNNQEWPTTRNDIENYVPGSIKEVAKIFNIYYDNNLQEDFNQVVKTILENSLEDEPQQQVGQRKRPMGDGSFYCRHKKDDPMLFWLWVLEEFASTMSEDLKLLIKKVLIVPMGSADAERAFSYLNLIKTKVTNSLGDDSLDARLRIQLNGRDYWRFTPRKYSREYSKNHILCDSKFRSPNKAPVIEKNPEIKDDEEEIREETRKSFLEQSNLF